MISKLSVGRRLYLLRMERYLTRETVAKSIGISSIRLERFETDLEMPERDTLIGLSKFYEVSLEFITSDNLLQTVVADAPKIEDIKTTIEGLYCLRENDFRLREPATSKILNKSIDLLSYLASILITVS
jgi:transcriptional regulator with XRE-family HTH domain